VVVVIISSRIEASHITPAPFSLTNLLTRNQFYETPFAPKN
jgi:hypothetical protein